MNKGSNKKYMENRKEKIAAVVVTYNRKELLKECLQSLMKQTRHLDLIILIDNASTDGTSEFLRENNILGSSNIDYLKLPKNTGGAGGFYEGVKRGVGKKFDWLWLMDDDAFPKNDALERLLEIKNDVNIEETGILGCLPLDPVFKKFSSFQMEDGKEILSEKEIKNKFAFVAHLPFVGVLLREKAIEKIGLPRKDFFIWWDDVEYSLRMRKAGFKVVLVKDSIIYHGAQKIDSAVDIPVLKRKFWIKSNANQPWKDYYDVRNQLYLIRNYRQGFIKKIKGVAWLIIFSFLSLVYRNEKISRLKYYFQGWSDGILNKYGSRILPK